MKEFTDRISEPKAVAELSDDELDHVSGGLRPVLAEETSVWKADANIVKSILTGGEQN